MRTPLSERSSTRSSTTAPRSPPACGSSSKRDARRVGGVRVLDGRFMTIRQAMGVGSSRGPAAAAAHLAAFVEDLKAAGFVADALARHGIEGASVAPAGDAD